MNDDAKKFVSTVSVGLKIFSKGLDLIADMVENYAYVPEEEGEKETPAPKTGAQEKKAKPAPRKRTAKKKGKGTMTDVVLQHVIDAESGIHIDQLEEQTGIEKKKLHGIVHRLRGQGRIRNMKQGVYVPAE